VRNSINQLIPVSGSFTDIAFDTLGYQTGGIFWTSGATITIPVSGFYSIVSQGNYEAAGIGGITGYLQVLVNSAAIIDVAELPCGTGQKTSLRGVMQRRFVVGDTVKMQTRHTGGVGMNMLSEGDFSPDIILRWEGV
jgi:hypothetical protein